MHAAQSGRFGQRDDHGAILGVAAEHQDITINPLAAL
jgi:hypothetical protein